MKCSNHLRNRLASVQPLELTNPTDSGGAAFISIGDMRFLGKINIGGQNIPEALMAQRTVTVVPLSPLVILPTSLAPFVAMILAGFWTVVTPVSSIFHICPGVTADGGSESRSSLYKWKNCFTFGSLNPIALDKLVPSGARILRSLKRERNPCNQSLPARPVVLLKQ